MNFQLEAIKYCKLDCQSLHEILIKFNTLIFSKFNINIDATLTLPSLAMRIYQTHFMPENSIYQLTGKIESDIRQSYSGGAVDVYIPHNRLSSFFNNVKTIFNKLYYYDVNSLYPFIMANTLMPIGLPFAFEGDIRAIDSNAFGFFYCKITSPDYIKHPILQRRIKTSEGLRTIAGLGTWNGWIYSLEMDNAMKHGYTFEILHGYQFEKGYVFKEYVNILYNLRLQYSKGDPMNLIAKLLMNSLYGKFGMKNEGSIIEIFDTKNEKDNQMLEATLDAYGETLEDYIQIGNHFLTVRKSLLNYINEEEQYHALDVNVAIASAITGGARVWMSTIKNSSKFNLYYSDTDSAVIDAPLPSVLVGPELGQFKLEQIIDRAVFLAPKVYGLVTSEGQEIIKVKGLNQESLDNINFKELEFLLIKDSSKEFNQDKWYKKIIEGEITVKEVAYTLKTTSNKRDAIYVDGVYSNTKPYYYDEIINNN